jgi:MoxR-like ATPase
MDSLNDVEQLARCKAACERIRQEVGRVIVGQSDVLDSLLVALLARGHVLLVGVPGLAKTLLVSSLAQALQLSFGRCNLRPTYCLRISQARTFLRI